MTEPPGFGLLRPPVPVAGPPRRAGAVPTSSAVALRRRAERGSAATACADDWTPLRELTAFGPPGRRPSESYRAVP